MGLNEFHNEENFDLSEEIVSGMLSEKDILRYIAERKHIKVSDIKGKHTLVGDLGFDSFDLTDLFITLEGKYGIRVESVDFWDLKTVEDVTKFIGNLVREKSKVE